MKDISQEDRCAQKLENEANITKKICASGEKSVPERCLVNSDFTKFFPLMLSIRLKTKVIFQYVRVMKTRKFRPNSFQF